MTYVIEGLDPGPYRALFALDDAELAKRAIVRQRADTAGGYPCRVALDDAPVGDVLLLLNHETRDDRSPYHAHHAIFVSEGAEKPARFVDELPPNVSKRRLSMRAFDAEGMMVDALVAEPGQEDAGLRSLFADPNVVEIDIHNAAHGCFAARARRHP